MEEAIKALIEKYEAELDEWGKLIDKYKGDGHMEHYYQGVSDETENFISDLKKLLEPPF